MLSIVTHNNSSLHPPPHSTSSSQSIPPRSPSPCLYKYASLPPTKTIFSTLYFYTFIFLPAKTMPTNPLIYFAFLIYSIVLIHCLTLILLFIITFLIFRSIRRSGGKESGSWVLGGGNSDGGDTPVCLCAKAESETDGDGGKAVDVVASTLCDTPLPQNSPGSIPFSHSFSSSATLVSSTPIIVFPRHASWSTSSTRGSSDGTLVGSRAGSDEGNG
jgi:hypothetical protein